MSGDWPFLFIFYENGEMSYYPVNMIYFPYFDRFLIDDSCADNFRIVFSSCFWPNGYGHFSHNNAPVIVPVVYTARHFFKKNIYIIPSIMISNLTMYISVCFFLFFFVLKRLNRSGPNRQHVCFHRHCWNIGE